MASRNEHPILELKHLTKSYASGHTLFSKPRSRVKALNAVNITVTRGGFFGIVGASGSGKTTLGRLVVKLETADSGEILFDGSDVTGLKGSALKSFRRRIQMICQDPYQSLNPYFNVHDTIEEPLLIHGSGNAAQRRQRIDALLDEVGLSPPEVFIRRYPHQLSGGQRQRVAIARAMILEPEFIVADEPTSMLDAPVSMQIYSLLSMLNRNHGVTFLFITHNIAAARALCDTVSVMHNGSIVESGPAGQVIESPVSDYTRQLIEAQPKVHR